jgi:hypothetical protein
MIYKYSQWIKESEKVEPSQEAMPTGGEEADLTPAQMETPAEPAETPIGEPAETEISDEPVDIVKFQEVDKARRDAIQAFKDKQKEFMDLPEETRKNPTTEEDKTKVKTIKDELIALNKTMTDSWTEWTKLNGQMLGLSDDDSVEP